MTPAHPQLVPSVVIDLTQTKTSVTVYNTISVYDITKSIIDNQEKLQIKRMPTDLASPLSLNSVVTLNVGGTKFVTTRQTLLKDPNSMLAKMFDSESSLQPGET